MANFAGIVLDTYDDPMGEVLREIVPDVSDIPDFVKTAQRIDAESTPPDDGYALVLISNGQKLCKYATVDKGNTALSVMYLLKQAHYLPPQAVKVAATNLIEACMRHGLAVPQHLKIAAASGISGVSGESQQPYLRGALSAQIETAMPEPPKETTLNPELGRGGVEDDVKKRTNVRSVEGTNPNEVPPFSTKERFSNQGGVAVDREKTASADAVLEHQGLIESFGKTPDQVELKKQNWRVSPYVDVQDWEPGASLQKEAAAPRRTLLRGKYPVDSFSQVKTAEAYFTEHQRRFHPRDRQTYCVKLAERMRELHIPIPEVIEKYASDTYCADVDSYVEFRKGFVSEEYHPSLDVLLEKRAMVSPGTFAEALCEFDQMTNLHYHWDAEIPDPWYSTFGPSSEKVAEAEWAFDEQGVRVDEEDLNNLARNGNALVVESFGEDFAKEFAKGPKTFFSALPSPNKMVLARMAMDRYSGTGTE